MTRELLRALEVVGAEEEALEAACAALSPLVADSDTLSQLAAEHRRTAAGLMAERPLARPLIAAVLATARGLVGDEVAALKWLRDREHGLVRAWLKLAEHIELDEHLRGWLRQEALPEAWSRFVRVDRLLRRREAGPALESA